MKRILIFASLVTGLLAAGCAQAPVTGKNEAAKRYFDAWTTVHYPNAPKTEFGSVIIKDEAGTGSLIGTEEETPYVYCTYLITDLEGNIQASTDMKTAQQLGTYSQTSYYGPRVLNRTAGRINAGVYEMMRTMRVGGTRTAAIPGWLMTTDVYETPEEYLENGSGSEAIYTFKILEAIKDVAQWEADSLHRYMRRHHPGVDSTAFGYYYIQTAAPLDTNGFEGDNTVYINYTGRNLTGQVFDTSIADTAKMYRIYQDTRTYEPTSLSWPSSDEDKVTFSSGNSMIDGFEKCVRSMKAGEKGICFFYSGLGYGLSGSGDMIPGYSPLIFEIQMLGLNEDGSIDSDE